MSLQIWLPLNGNVKDQGISDVRVENNGATVNDNGKIGKCYDFGNSGSYLKFAYPASNLQEEWSFCCWIKPTDFTNYNSLFCNRKSVSYGISIFTIPGTGQVRFDNGTDSVTSCKTFNTALTINTWQHLCLVQTSTNRLLYIDGILKETISASSVSSGNTAKNVFIGASSGNDSTASGNYFHGSLNDIRIYNHALSVKEIKEIAKGLILHYKLSKPLPNLAYGGNTRDLSLNKWYVSNQVGDSTRTLEFDEFGIPCVRITRDSTAQSGWHFFHYDNIQRNLIKTSTTYTVSFDIKASVSGTIAINGFMQGNATNSLTASSRNIQNTVIANQWSHIILQITTKDDFSGITIGSQVIYMYVSTELRAINVSMLLKNIKLEEGTKETSWIPNVSDNLYSAFGYANNIEYDKSGYNRNGTIEGSIAATADTPRYISSYEFLDDCAQYIKGPLLNWINQTGFTMSCWFYKKTHERTSGGTTALGNQFIFSQGRDWFASDATSYHGVNIASTSDGKIWIPIGNTSFTSTINIPLNTWTHVVLTYDGITAKLYINGALNNSKDIVNSTIEWGYANDAIVIGKMSHNNISTTNYFPFVGNISDARVYCTPLSADDVKALYMDSASIDKNGNFHAYEYVEDDSAEHVDINKQGVFTIPEEIIENDLKEPSIDNENIYAKGGFYED